jgi:hypothetical protein
MSGIHNVTIQEFQERISNFNETYVKDWNTWLNTTEENRPFQLGVILRKWQACRPNRMRRVQAESEHDPPYIEDLVENASSHTEMLQCFDIRLATSFTQEVSIALHCMWDIFEQLCFQGIANAGHASIVGISKAVLLLSNGRVGPAFDSNVRGQLNLGEINDANAWIDALQMVNMDIHAFEMANLITLQEAAPNYGHLHSGRIYDMALGPRTQ